MRDLRASRSNAESFSDLLGWAVHAGSGHVQTRGGDHLMGFWSSPPDYSSADPSARSALSFRINEALRQMGTGWSVWSDVCVVPSVDYPAATASSFQAGAAAAVDEERRRQFQQPGAHYQRDHALIFSFTPPAAAAGRMADAMHGATRRRPFDVATGLVQQEMARLENQIGSSLGLRRMQSYTSQGMGGEELLHDELVSYLAYCAYGRHFPLAIPEGGAFLDTVIGGREFWTGETLTLGQEHIAIVALDGFPAVSVPGILDYVSSLQLPGGYRFTQRFIFLDPEHAVAEIKKYRRRWSQQVVPFLAATLGAKMKAVNGDAQAQVADADAATTMAQSRRVRFGFYNGAFVLRHRDQGVLMDMATKVERAINDCRFGARTEGMNATEAFMSTLPGNVEANIRRPPVHTANLSDLIPASGVWTGSAVAPSPFLPAGSPPLMLGVTEGGLPFNFNIHVHDNANFAFFGPPGAGKTALLNGVASQYLRYPGAVARSIDLKGGMLVACSAAGGRYIEVGRDSTPAFAPFAFLETESDRLWAEGFVSDCFMLQRNGTKLEDQQRIAIRDALNVLASNPGFRAISNFCLTVQDRQVRDAMSFYQDGMFDATEEEAVATVWDAFDITAILHAGVEILLPATLCLLRKFERGVNSKPQIWTMDEVGVQISVPFWRARLRSMLKLYRSRNVAIGLATQNLADMTGADMLSIFQENVPTMVFGANPKAQLGGAGDERGAADFYQSFGFTHQQREIIRLAEPKRDYYINQGSNSRLVDFAFGPAAVALWASTSEADVIAAREILSSTSPGLPFARAWLRHKRISDEILG